MVALLVPPSIVLSPPFVVPGTQSKLTDILLKMPSVLNISLKYIFHKWCEVDASNKYTAISNQDIYLDFNCLSTVF